jgi:hypothetical protein
MDLAARNLNSLEKAPAWSAGWPEDAGTAWLAMWQSIPGAPKAPYSPEAMERFYREWLSFFGAVPRKDYEDLKQKFEALLAQREGMGKAMEAISQSLSGFKEVPEAMKPWLEFVDKAAKAQMEWLSDLGKSSDKKG